eukprot:179151-Ditylum_brightwellii.AAC.1
MPTGGACDTFRQFSKQYKLASRLWEGEPLYWLYAKCAISAQHIRMTTKHNSKLTIMEHMKQKFMLHCFPQYFDTKQPPQKQIDTDTKKYLAMHRSYCVKPETH